MTAHLSILVDKLWDELWEVEKRKKDERAERELYEQRQRNQEQKELLDAQVAAINDTRAQEALLRQQAEQFRVCDFSFVIFGLWFLFVYFLLKGFFKRGYSLGLAS
jgi:hypothetical protein